MHWDEAAGRRDAREPFGETIRTKFRSHGLQPPIVVLWNLADPGRALFQAKADTEGVMLLSSYSPRLFVDFLADRSAALGDEERVAARTLSERVRSESYALLWAAIASSGVAANLADSSV
jgi:hypothetical protein